MIENRYHFFFSLPAKCGVLSITRNQPSASKGGVFKKKDEKKKDDKKDKKKGVDEKGKGSPGQVPAGLGNRPPPNAFVLPPLPPKK